MYLGFAFFFFPSFHVTLEGHREFYNDLITVINIHDYLQIH